MSAAITLRDVRASYGSVEVLHGVTLDAPAGAVTAILGPNGAGKSTTLKAIAGLSPVRAGSVLWAGRDITKLTALQRAKAGMLLVPERRGIFPDLTVEDNLEVFSDTRDVHESCEVAFDAFPVLRDRLPQRAGSLSGGEQQMLAMSRVLLQKPQVLLLDEISFGLAPLVTQQLFEVVTELARSATTVLLVEQHLNDALRLADVVYVLSRGEVVFAGEPGELEGRAQLPGYAVARSRPSA